MSWTTLTEEHLKSRLSRDELDAYVETADQGVAGSDTVAAILSQVSSMVRGKVASNQDNLGKLGPSGTIPEECLFAACTIGRDSLAATLPLSEGDTDARKEENRKAHAFLDAVAEGKVRIEDSTGSIPEATTSGATYGGATRLDF